MLAVVDLADLRTVLAAECGYTANIAKRSKVSLAYADFEPRHTLSLSIKGLVIICKAVSPSLAVSDVWRFLAGTTSCLWPQRVAWLCLKLARQLTWPYLLLVSISEISLSLFGLRYRCELMRIQHQIVSRSMPSIRSSLSRLDRHVRTLTLGNRKYTSVSGLYHWTIFTTEATENNAQDPRFVCVQ